MRYRLSLLLAWLSLVLFFIEPHAAFAARLFSSGCEFQSDAPGAMTNNLEFEREGSASTVTQVSASTKRSGLSSCRVVASPGVGWGSFNHAYASTDVAGPLYVRFYLKAATMPTELTDILLMKSTGSTVGTLILNPDGRLSWEQWVEDASPDFTTAAPVITSNDWYRIEVMYNGNRQVIVRVDGVEVLNFKDTGSAAGAYMIKLGMCSYYCGGDAMTSADLYFDDIAINDSTGSKQVSWPGSGSIVHMQANAAGDSNNCLSPGSFLNIDEVTPDDSLTICNLTQNNDKVEVNLESPQSAGIDPRDSITLVQVGVREKAASASAEEWQLLIKSQAGATASSSARYTHDDTTFKTNGDSGSVTYPLNYKFTAYTDPTTHCGWTQTGTNSLENMQIGVRATVANPDVNVTAIWALVEYDARFAEPCSPPHAANPPNAISTGASFSSFYKQIKSGSVWAPSLAVDKICMGNSSDCTSVWNRVPKCRLEHFRVTARPNALNFTSMNLPDFSTNIASNSCDSMLSSASVSAGWVGTGYDYSERVFSGSSQAPRICQFMRLVCDRNVSVLTPTVTAPASYPVTDFTTSTYACSNGLDDDGDGDYDYPNDLGCTSWSDNGEGPASGGGGGAGCPTCQIP